MKTIAFVCLNPIFLITCLAEPSQNILKNMIDCLKLWSQQWQMHILLILQLVKVKQATQGLEAKNNLCRAAQAKLNLTTFLKDNLEESKELYKSIDGAETLDKNYLSGQQQEQQNLVSNLKKDLVGTGFNCE